MDIKSCLRMARLSPRYPLTALAAALSTLALAGAGQAAFAQSIVAQPHTVHAAHAKLSDSAMSYLGVSAAGSPMSYKPVEAFGKAVGREPNLVEDFMGWGSFSASEAQTAWKHHASLLMDVDPVNVSVRSIADGGQDAHLVALAEAVRRFGHPVVISFGHEMNGSWYSWGWERTSPAAFVLAWRHIVRIFQRERADNVTWLWTINGVSANEGPIRDWWPGSKYVTWVGVDSYFYTEGSTFASVFGPTIKAVRAVTSKPILIAETAVGQVAGQAAKIPGLFAGASHAHLLGFLWFDLDQQGSLYKQDWRLEGHRAAVAAFKKAAKRYLRLVKA
jgi:mannan endo-1,4-beta-mannosidase